MELKAKFDKQTGTVKVVDVQRYQDNILSAHKQVLQQLGITDDVLRPILAKVDTQRTTNELIKIVQRKQEDDHYNELTKAYDDYKPLVEERPASVGQYKCLVPTYEERDNEIVAKYSEVTDTDAINNDIAAYQKQLNDTDYIIIKTYEAKLLGEKQPYTDDEFEKVADQRKQLREKINDLQKLL